MLNMQSVTKKFGDFTALDELSMDVPQGAVYGLVGPNGAGKSTAIRLLTGIYRPDSGSITMDGAPIYENPAIKERICSIGDEIFYFPAASMEDMRKFYKGIYPRFSCRKKVRSVDSPRACKSKPLSIFPSAPVRMCWYWTSLWMVWIRSCAGRCGV